MAHEAPGAILQMIHATPHTHTYTQGERPRCSHACLLFVGGGGGEAGGVRSRRNVDTWKGSRRICCSSSSWVQIRQGGMTLALPDAQASNSDVKAVSLVVGRYACSTCSPQNKVVPGSAVGRGGERGWGSAEANACLCRLASVELSWVGAGMGTLLGGQGADSKTSAGPFRQTRPFQWISLLTYACTHVHARAWSTSACFSLPCLFFLLP